MAYELAQLLREAGIKAGVVIAPIDAPAWMDRELEALIRRIVRYWSGRRVEVLKAYAEAIISGNESGVKAAMIAGEAAATLRVQTFEEQVTGLFQRISAWHDKRWSASVKAAGPIDIAPLMQNDAIRPVLRAAVERNVSLVKGLSADTQKRMERAVWDAWERGEGVSGLRKTLKDEFAIAPKRAKLIARDQVGKITSALDQARHTEAGIKEYRWMTVRDQRVRAEHRKRHGRKYKYKKPPNDGHPGQAINCRCKARAVLPGLDLKPGGG